VVPRIKEKGLGVLICVEDRPRLSATGRVRTLTMSAIDNRHGVGCPVRDVDGIGRFIYGHVIRRGTDSGDWVWLIAARIHRGIASRAVDDGDGTIKSGHVDGVGGLIDR